jgi:hypothetical protein
LFQLVNHFLLTDRTINESTDFVNNSFPTVQCIQGLSAAFNGSFFKVRDEILTTLTLLIEHPNLRLDSGINKPIRKQPDVFNMDKFEDNSEAVGQLLNNAFLSINEFIVLLR